MKTKARANLQASKTLIGGGMIDPAMSRLYYALFQAGVQALENAGKTPSSLGPYQEWKHSTVRESAYLMRKDQSDKLLFQDACALREQADYLPVPVNRKRVEELIPIVEAFVRAVCP